MAKKKSKPVPLENPGRFRCERCLYFSCGSSQLGGTCTYKGQECYRSTGSPACTCFEPIPYTTIAARWAERQAAEQAHKMAERKQP
jgi:hypothetical protein